MEIFFVLLGLAALSLPVGAVLGWIAFFRERRLRQEVAHLRAVVARLGPAGMASLPPAVPARPTPWGAPWVLEPEPPVPPAQAEPLPPGARLDERGALLPANDALPPETPADASPADAVPGEPVSPEPVPPDPGLPEPIAAPAAPMPPGPPLSGVSAGEQRAARWAVWVGGVALAFAGIYLVRYWIDAGLLGPAMRIAMGLVLGAGLVAAGEWTRRRGAGGHVPAALSGAGIVTAFADVYAAYALYGLIGPTLAFAGLAAVAAASLVLALRQGVFLAALGLVAAYVVPAMVSTQTPDALALFPYLAIVTAGCLAVILYRAWAWLGWAAAVGSLVWVPLWYLGPWTAGDAATIGLYLAVVSALFVGFVAMARGEAAVLGGQSRATRMPPEQIALAVAGTVALLAFALLRMADYSHLTISVLVLLSAGWMAAGRRWQALDLAPWPFALAALAAVATHDVPQIVASLAEQGLLPDVTAPAVLAPALPPGARPFLMLAIGLGSLFLAGGFAALWRAAVPGRWAALSAGTSVVMMALSYAQLEDFVRSLPFAGAAAALALLLLVAAERTARHVDEPGMSAALAAFATGALAAIALTLTMLLRDAWLTVGLSVLLPALLWIRRRTGAAPLDGLASVLAGVILVRLVLNPWVLEYPHGSMPILNGLLYAYGVPIAAVWLALRQAEPASRLHAMLRLSLAALTTMFLSLEIRHAAHAGDLQATDYALGESGALTVAWLVVAIALKAWPDAVSRWASGLLVAAAAVNTLLAVTVLNPLETGLIPGWPLANALTLAYGLPALLFGVLCVQARDRVPKGLYGVTALVLGFVDVSLEVRKAFSGPDLSQGDIGAAEQWAYSITWLAYAAAVLLAGIATGQRVLRQLGLGLVAAVALKVFLFDMAGLEGLWRVASFLGLGLSLIGIGWIYQRMILRAPAPPPAPPPSGLTEEG